jgi:hypothetical protein
MSYPKRRSNRKPSSGRVYRTIFCVDLEKSTERMDLVKGRLRIVMYDLIEKALAEAGITEKHREQLTDGGDSVRVLIRPHDEVPKALLLSKLIPALTTFLVEYNASVAEPELKMRMRAVIHSGDLEIDDRGFYGETLDVAYRFLENAKLKKILREETDLPLVLVISREIYSSIVRHSGVDRKAYEGRIRVRVCGQYYQGWVHIPTPLLSGLASFPRPARGPTPCPASGQGIFFRPPAVAVRVTIGYHARSSRAQYSAAWALPP